MKNKVYRYMGLATKAGKIVSGTNTCSFAMSKGKVKLAIIAEDISKNGEQKILKAVRKYDVPYLYYGNTQDLSGATGNSNRSVFGVCDSNFSEVILKEIENGS